MRTDIQVGAIIAIVLVGIFVVGIVYLRGGGDEPADQTGQQAPAGEQEAPEGDGLQYAGESSSGEVIAERPSESTAGSATGDWSAGGGWTTGSTGAPETPAGSTPPTGEGPAESASSGTTKPPPWEGDFTPPEHTPSRMTPPAGGTASGRAAGDPAVARATAGSYKVKAGDSYWRIAKELWGDAGLHKALVEANPNIAPDRLRPEMTIKVPARPVAPAARSRVPAIAAHGKTAIDPATGKRCYVVKAGDNGFWGVSAAVYDTGKHWRAVQAANPGLDPRKLRPGRKVFLPSELASTPSGPSVAAVRQPGREVIGTGTGAPRTAALPDGTRFD